MDWKIEVIVVPVTDIDRAKRFYAEQCGFNVDHDSSFGESTRIIQFTPPGSGCSLVVGTMMKEMAPGSLKGVQFVVADVAAARAQLVEKGVECSPVRHIDNGEWLDGPGGPWNSFVFFSDPDGNSYVIQEKPS
jgi:catechol 2,3-dioxygenase-like lactoylglutathione lyase family enzyme